MSARSSTTRRRSHRSRRTGPLAAAWLNVRTAGWLGRQFCRLTFSEARRVVRKARGSCEARRIDAARAREELAEHIADLVFGVPVARLTVGFGHCRHLQVASPQP